MRFTAWMITLLAAAGLLGLGYHWGFQAQLAGMEELRARASQEAGRANRLEADAHKVEQRLAQAQTQLDQCQTRAERLAGQMARQPRPPAPSPAPAPAPEAKTRTVSKGQALMVLDNRVAVTLEKVEGQPRAAHLWIRVLGGREGRAALRAGSSISFRVEGRLYRLVIKQVHATVASFYLLEEKAP